jgi:hypothetical protein
MTAAALAELLASPSRHGVVTVLSMMKDEGPYLLEWVAHQLALGFTRVVVYTNDCTDGTDRMLMRLEELGLAHHRVNAIPAGLSPQPSALSHALAEPLVLGSDWLIVCDADEFLCIRHGDGSLGGLLDAVTAQGANGIVVTWRIFGSSAVQDWSCAPVCEQYLSAAPEGWNRGWGVKTLFRFDPGHWKLGIHRPKIRNRSIGAGFPATVRWLNGSGVPMEDEFRFHGWRSIRRTVGHDWAQMNHYAVKSIDSYALRKARGNVNFKPDKYTTGYWALMDRNEVRCEAILRHAPARRRVFEALLRDPVLHRLHRAALAGAEEKIAAFRATDAYATLVAGLGEAGRVPIEAVVARPPKPRDPARIAAILDRAGAGRRRRGASAATPEAAPQAFSGPPPLSRWSVS